MLEHRLINEHAHAHTHTHIAIDRRAASRRQCVAGDAERRAGRRHRQRGRGASQRRGDGRRVRDADRERALRAAGAHAAGGDVVGRRAARGIARRAVWRRRVGAGALRSHAGAAAVASSRLSLLCSLLLSVYQAAVARHLNLLARSLANSFHRI
jgi:hypothetical protein